MTTRTAQSRIQRLAFCYGLAYHSLDNIDNVVKTLISDSLSRFHSSYWKPGNFWEMKEPEDLEKFDTSFEVELRKSKETYEGIQTRAIGSIVIDRPEILLDECNSLKHMVMFRKIHDAYLLMFMCFSNVIDTNIRDCMNSFNLLKKEAMSLSNLIFMTTAKSVRYNVIGPPFLFYLIQQIDNRIEVEEDLAQKDSDLSFFLREHFCAQGVPYKNLPRSSIDDKIIVIRHHSYHFHPEMSEKFLFFPSALQIDDSFLIRAVDIFASMEYYFTMFFWAVRTTATLVEEIDANTQPIFSVLEQARLPSLTPKETIQILTDMTSRSQTLFGIYPRADQMLQHAEHAYEDAGYLISGIVSPSSYSQLTEKRLSEIVEGAAESIGKELQMRLSHAKNKLPRILGRSYSTVNSVSNLVRAHYESILNRTMVDYTRHIKILTIAIMVLTILGVIFTIISLSPKLQKVLTRLFPL